MWYVVTGLVPARIEVRPSNGLGSDSPNLESQMHLDQRQASTGNRIMANDITTTAQGGDKPLNH
jgi:hypothetical protein